MDPGQISELSDLILSAPSNHFCRHLAFLFRWGPFGNIITVCDLLKKGSLCFPSFPLAKGSLSGTGLCPGPVACRSRFPEPLGSGVPPVGTPKKNDGSSSIGSDLSPPAVLAASGSGSGSLFFFFFFWPSFLFPFCVSGKVPLSSPSFLPPAQLKQPLRGFLFEFLNL